MRQQSAHLPFAAKAFSGFREVDRFEQSRGSLHLGVEGLLEPWESKSLMFSTHQLAATEVWEEFISPAEASHGNSQSSPKLASSRLSHCVHMQKGPLKGEAGSLGPGSLYSKTNCIHGEDKQKNIQQGLATTKKE